MFDQKLSYLACNSPHLPDQALNGFLWFLKVTHLEKRKICCHWERPEHALQILMVTQKRSSQDVLCFSSAVGISVQSSRVTSGKWDSSHTMLEFWCGLLKVRHLFPVYFWYATGSLSSNKLLSCIHSANICSHHLPNAVGSGDSNEYLLCCSLGKFTISWIKERIKELVLNFAKNLWLQSDCVRRTNGEICVPGRWWGCDQRTFHFIVYT